MNGERTKLPIKFLIVGAGLTGLASAIALRRVGHHVIVLDRIGLNDPHSGGVRLAPNATKILFHWGLEKELRSISVSSGAVGVFLFESGEYLGPHVWDEELLREARGEYMHIYHSDLRQLLYQTAVRLGAKVHLNSDITHIDAHRRTVQLSTGHVFKGDVIVAADGPAGIGRRQLLEAEGKTDRDATSLGWMVFNTTVPKAAILKDPDLRFLLEHPHGTLFVWFGNGRFMYSFALGRTGDFCVLITAPHDGSDRTWKDRVPPAHMIRQGGNPRIQKLLRLVRPAACMQIKQCPQLEDWVHESGRMVAVGDAAHPLQPVGLQTCAMAIEDGAVLAKLFSHLLTEDQIPSFLYAFQDLRSTRVSRMFTTEMRNIATMCLPPSPIQHMRDQSMREKHKEGGNVLEGEGGDIAEQWEEIKMVFGYDAEDAADDWWVKWGMLRERARGYAMPVIDWETSIKSVEVDSVGA